MSRPVRLVPLQPYDGQTGLLIPFVLERVKKMARERAGEMDPGQFTMNVGARVYRGDPSIALLAFLDEKSVLVGHALATIESDGTNTWVFVSQVSMDPGDWGDAVVQAVRICDDWAGRHSEALVARGRKPITEMMMATHRDDKGWIKKYGFKTRRTLMVREIGTKEDVTE